MDMFARYSAAQKLLTKHTRNAVLNGRPSITWAGGSRFFYTRQVRTEQGVKNVKVHVDAISGEEWIETEHVEESRVAVEQETGRKIETKKTDCAVSPDGKYEIFTKEHNLMLLEKETGETTALTSDGETLCEYGCYIDIYSQITVQRDDGGKQPSILWSPNGEYFITYKADRRKCPKLYVLESFVNGLNDIRPVLRDYPCPFVMDSDEEIPHYSLYIGNVKNKSMTKINAPEFLYPVFTEAGRSWVRWMEDSSAFYFTWIKRGFQEGRMYLGNPKDGSVQLLIKETTNLFLNLGAFGQVDGYGSYLFSNFVTSDKKYAFWQSERTGFAHLYRIDLEKIDKNEGAFLNESEKTDWVCELLEEHLELIVQKLVKVDEHKQLIYFMGNNVSDCSDPLYYQLFVVGFDGNGLKRLTPEDAVHAVTIGENAFVDTYSRVDLPPVTVLRNLDGTLIRELERADVSDLLAAGYQLPERFTVKSADGAYDLHGILVKPADFDPQKKYPVIDYIYGGAQLYNVPRDFTWDNSMNREIMGGLQEFGQLGFVGIILDGRGTPGRGMNYHSYSYHKIHGCAGLEDHVFCADELKEKYPFMDFERIGMWGNSGGGYATVSAMFQYPEFYKVGVASSGNYDQRMYEHSWTERYNGLYDEEIYRLGDITRLADRLQGKLMLAYGAMDDNVTMSQTLRLCDELNKHNKDYDLVVIPRMNHNVPSDMYFIRRKMDFFVKHLLGEEPPKEFVLE